MGRLRDLIRDVRTCRTAAEERAMVAKASAAIRNSFGSNDDSHRQRNVAKLLYVHMLGYPTKFGQMEPLKLLSSPYYSDKRVGYLGLMLLLNEETEVLMLATNSIKQDLGHPNPFVVGLALCSLANISNTGMARDVVTDITKLLSSSNPYIRKKAALVAIRIIRKVPDLLEHFVPKIRALLNEKHHGVLVTAVTLLIEMCETEPETVIKVFRPLVTHLVRIMKSLIMTGYVVDYDVGGVTDPFLQVKILHLLRILGKGSPQASEKMNDLLAQVATNTEGSRNVGTAILLECVKTIMSIESESGLRVLAINLLGRFLVNRDNNIRYVALNSLSKFASRETKAIQQHRNMIVECLKDADISIRRRALDLVYLLVNKKNVRVLVREMLNYLLVADVEFRADLTAKICFVTERFAPSSKWHVDCILRVMAIAGDYVSDEVVSNLVNLVVGDEDLHLYAVGKMYFALQKDMMTQRLVQLCVWTIGEFGDTLVQGSSDQAQKALSVQPQDIIELMNSVVVHPSTNGTTRDFVLTAMLKLTERVPSSEAIRTATHQLIEKFVPAVDLELQTRACEYQELLRAIQDRSVLSRLLAKVPPLERFDDEDDEEGADGDGSDSGTTTTTSTSSSSSRAASKSTEAAAATTALPSTKQATPAPQSNPLLEIFGSGATTTLSPAVSTTTTTSNNAAAALSGIFGGGSPVPAAASPSTPAASVDPLASVFGASPAPAPTSSTPSLVPVSATPSAMTPTPLTPTSSAGGGGVLRPQNSIHPGLPGSSQPFVAFDEGGVTVHFSFLKKNDAPHLTLVNALVKNNTGAAISGFEMQVAVPNFIQMQMGSASSSNLPASGNPIKQQIKLNNSMHGKKPLLMKLKIVYSLKGQRIEKVAPPLTMNV